MRILPLLLLRVVLLAFIFLLHPGVSEDPVHLFLHNCLTPPLPSPSKSVGPRFPEVSLDPPAVCRRRRRSLFPLLVLTLKCDFSPKRLGVCENQKREKW